MIAASQSSPSAPSITANPTIRSHYAEPTNYLRVSTGVCSNVRMHPRREGYRLRTLRVLLAAVIQRLQPTIMS